MVLIILSWMYILFTTINLGFGLDKIMKFKNDDFCITVFLGLFTTTIFTTIWAIFGRINIEFHSVLLVANTIIFFKYKTDIKEKYFLFWKSITELSIALKWILFLISFLIIAQCAAAPYIIDNESYYIQTTKWINEYGFVKGLANLHIFFGQTSGWHIAQSAFNFSFIYKNFNDLSGFCLLIGTVFSIFKLEKFFSNSDKNYLIIGLIPLANVFFFQFISAPSPDIPVYILTFIVFFYVLNNFKNIQISDYNLITTLVLFTLFIKTTAIALLLFPLVLFIFNFKKIVRNLVPIGFLGALVFILFIIKNTIITGYPFFPTRTFGLMNLDFGVPQNVISFLFQ